MHTFVSFYHYRYLTLDTTFTENRLSVLENRISFHSPSFVQALNGDTFNGQLMCTLRNGTQIQQDVIYDVLNDFYNCSTVNGGFRTGSLASTIGVTEFYTYTGYNGPCGVYFGPVVSPLSSSDVLEADPLSVGGKVFILTGEPDCELGVTCNATEITPGVCDSNLGGSAQVTAAPLPFSVVDPDGLENSNFFYSIASGNDGSYFAIASDTGVLTLVRTLDRDAGPGTFVIAIAVTDGPFEATLTFSITITDENDNPPVPSVSPVVGSVREGAPISTSAAMFNFTDNDDGVNAEITYFFSDPSSNFNTPDNRVGVIVTSRVFDYEAGDLFFVLTVVATDGGSPPLTGTVTS